MSVDLNKGATVELVKTLSDDIRTKADGSVANSAGAAIREQFTDLKTAITNLSDSVDKIVFADVDTFTSGTYINASASSIGTDWTTLLVQNSASDYLAESIDLTGHIGDVLVLKVSGKFSSSSRAFGFCNSENIISSVFVEKEVNYGEKVDGFYTVKLPITDTHFYFSFSREGTYTARDIEIIGEVDVFKNRVLETTYSKDVIDGLVSENKTAYIDVNGNDTNDGSAEHPLATVNKALEKGANVVMVNSGKYIQNIDISKLNGSELELISATPTGKAVFYDPDYVISTSETAETGFTKVYKCTCDRTFDTNNNRIFQDGVNDVTTIITNAERHPLQRGLEYRCLDTMISKCISAVLSDALTEIEGSTSYKFFYDVSNSMLYFSRPQAISADHPLSMSSNGSLFINRDRSKTIKAIGIVSKYQMFNVSYLHNPVMIDCACHNVYGSAGFLYTKTISAHFERCEVSRVFTGGNGDGFNAHSESSGDYTGKQTTATLIDCWAHDITDDGYSDHERSETSIFGGLFEYCGKGGVTPSYGSHCTCHNAYSRKNSYNFYYTGQATQAEGGKYGQMICYNCVAEANNYSQGAGFAVDGVGNKLLLVGCKAISNRYAYSAGSDTVIEIIDCKTGNNITAESRGSGTITTKL